MELLSDNTGIPDVIWGVTVPCGTWPGHLIAVLFFSLLPFIEYLFCLRCPALLHLLELRKLKKLPHHPDIKGLLFSGVSVPLQAPL